MGTRSSRYCDISGTEEDVEAHVINIDQMRVEVDLAGREYRKLLELLQPYIGAGVLEASAPDLPRATVSTTGRKQRHRTGTDLNKDEREQLRQWAEDNGIPVAANNRFKMSTVQQWRTEATETD